MTSPRVSYRQAIAGNEFRSLVVARFVSTSGTSVAAVALTVLIFVRTGSPVLASLAFAVGFVPYIFGGGLLSALVDRVRPRRLVNRCDVGAAVLAAAMALPHAPVVVLLALLFGIGTLSALSSGAIADLVRYSVAHDAYVTARSWQRLAAQFGQIGGNAAGGALIVVLAPSGLMLINSASFVFSAAAVRLMVKDYPNSGRAANATVLVDSLRGIGQIFSRPQLVRLLLLGWFGPMLAAMPEAVAAPYVANHNQPSSWVGWWLIAAPLGIAIGNIACVRLFTPVQQHRLVAPLALASFVPLLAVGANPSVTVAMTLILVSNMAGMYMVGLDGRVRDEVPEQLFARTMALNAAGLAVAEGLGFTLGGTAAQYLGPAAAVFAAGACGVAMTVLLVGRELRPARKSWLPNQEDGRDEYQPRQ